MPLRPVQVNIKALDDSAVGGFWAEALGWGVSSEAPGVTNVEPTGGFVWPDPVAVCIDVVAVPEPKTPAKNRVHIDLATTSAAHQAELVARMKALGATPADVGQGEVPWTVLADPNASNWRFWKIHQVSGHAEAPAMCHSDAQRGPFGVGSGS